MDHKPMYRLMKPTLLFALTLLLCSCQPSDAPPQVVRVEAPAPQLAPAPAPAVDAQPDMIMKSYSLPEGHTDRTYSVINSLLAWGDNPVGRVSQGPNNTVVVIAPAGIHSGIAALLESIQETPPEKSPSSIEMHYWLVAGKAHVDGSRASVPAELKATLDEVRAAQGRPMDFELVEEVSVLSFDGERASTDGRDSFVSQRLNLLDGYVMAELKIGTQRGQQVETRVRLAPERTLVFGMVGMEPELQGSSGIEIGATKQDVTLYFIVKAHVLDNPAP